MTCIMHNIYLFLTYPLAKKHRSEYFVLLIDINCISKVVSFRGCAIYKTPVNRISYKFNVMLKLSSICMASLQRFLEV